MFGIAYISMKSRMRFALYWNIDFPRIVPTNAEIFEHVRSNSVEDVMRLIGSGKASTQDATISGITLLHTASKTRNAEMVAMLIREGADINAVNEDGETPLHGAMATRRNYDTARLLIENGADLSNRAIDGRTPLHNIFSDTVGQVLMRDNAWVEETIADSLGLSITHYLVWSSQSTVEVLQRCRRSDMVDLQALDTYGRSHIHLAASRGNLDVLSYLLNLAPPGKVNEKDRRGCTPLHYLAQSSRAPATMDLLLRKGSNIYATDKSQKTALHYAALWGNLEAARALVGRDKAGKLLIIRDRDGRLPSSLASTDKSPVLREYLEHNESIQRVRRNSSLPVARAMSMMFGVMLFIRSAAILLLAGILFRFLRWAVSRTTANLTEVKVHMNQ